MTADYPWGSSAVLAAELLADATIARANPALERVAAPGDRFSDLLAPAQQAAFADRLAAAGPDWTRATFAFPADPARPAIDREVWLRRAGERTTVIAEPAVGEGERLVEKVLELNDDLVTAHRELVRQREALVAAAERIRHLEAISSAGLARLRLTDVLEDVLRAVAEAVAAPHAAILLPDATGVLHVAAGDAPESAADLAEQVVADGRPRVGADSAAVALHLDADVIGVLHVGGRVTDDDLRLLVPGAERAAVAIARAQVHEREHAIAETLQRALLPDRLPQVPGLDLAARFIPGAGVDVGGDWYDALPLPSGELAVAIGDVAGKGVRAAALMGEVRSGLRAYALDGPGDPAEALGRLNGLVRRAREMATVLLAYLDPVSGAVRYASAGHLPPLVVDGAGEPRLLHGGRAAPLLAYEPAAPGHEALGPGDTLVLYTDGLVERRTEAIDEGLERLTAAARGPAGSAGELCDRLLERMAAPGDAPRDDTALIAVRR